LKKLNWIVNVLVNNNMVKKRKKRKRSQDTNPLPAQRKQQNSKVPASLALDTILITSSLSEVRTFNWPEGLPKRLRKFGVAVFVKSDVENKYPDIRTWFETHYLSLDADSKEFVGGAENGLEVLQLREKKLAHFGRTFCQKTTDIRVKECWNYMETHAKLCMNSIISGLQLVDGVSPVELRRTYDESNSSVLSVFVYDAQPAGRIICPDHVDRGFITCTTNQDGGLEFLVNGRWLAVPPTNSLICFTGYALHKMSGGEIPMVRHRVVSRSSGTKRISVAFKLRPDEWRSRWCGPMSKIIKDFEEQYISVNKPQYQILEKPSHLVDLAAVGISSLRPAAFLELCLKNGLPWQQKPPGVRWPDFCKSWNEKVRAWDEKEFQIWENVSPIEMMRPYGLLRLKPKPRKWSAVLTEQELSSKGLINVYDSDPRSNERVKSISLGPTIGMFKDFVPRWGEVFELYTMQIDAVTLEPKFIVQILTMRGD